MWAKTPIETMRWAKSLDRTTPRLQAAVTSIEASAAAIADMQARIKAAEEKLDKMVRNHEAEVAGLSAMVAKLWTNEQIAAAQEIDAVLGKEV